MRLGVKTVGRQWLIACAIAVSTALVASTFAGLAVSPAHAEEAVAPSSDSTGPAVAEEASVESASPSVIKSAKPKFTGTAKVGKKLKAVTGKWSPKASFSYRWLRDGKPIKGAVKSSYKLKAADAGKKISLRVTGSLEGHKSAKKTSSAKQVRKGALKAGSVSVKGTAKLGKTLKAKAGKWTKGTKVSYRWTRDGKRIKGAVKSSYKVTAADSGKKIRVEVTAKKAGYEKRVKKSSAKKVAKLSNKSIWMHQAGIKEADWGYVDHIVSHESGWNPRAVSASGASGLVQALPCGKVSGDCLDPVDNLKWAKGYAKQRYGSWKGASQQIRSNGWW